MLSRFAEVDRAVWYLCLGFREHHFNDQVEVFWQPPGNHPRRSVVTGVRYMETTLKLACRRFPQAAVVFEEHYLDVPFGGIQCKCPPSNPPKCLCDSRHHEDRPVVCAVLVPDGKPCPDSTRAEVVEAFLEILRQDRESHKSIIDKEKLKKHLADRHDDRRSARPTY